MNRVLNIGSLNIDHVYRVDHITRPGESLASSSYARFAGGKGFNQSVALARAGAFVTHAGCIGPDGGWLRDFLANEGVNVSRLLTSEAPTGHAIIQVAADGENSIVLFPGANVTPAPADAFRWLDGFGRGDWFVCQNETSCVPELLTAARERGLTVCFNPAPMRPEVRDWPLDAVDWLVLNETEGAELSGATEPDAILDALHARWPATAVLLSLGAAGAVCRRGHDLIRVAAPRVDAVDTTAAGDTLIGYFVAALAAGGEVEPALARACRAAALCVTRPGAAASVPRADEIN